MLGQIGTIEKAKKEKKGKYPQGYQGQEMKMGRAWLLSRFAMRSCFASLPAAPCFSTLKSS